MQVNGEQYQRVLGEELRILRAHKGWTRKELRQQLGNQVSIQTLATYELGTRQCSVVRLVELCCALGEHPHELLARVQDRVFGNDDGHVRLDLATIAGETRTKLAPLQRWADKKLRQLGGNGPTEFVLDSAAIEHMAELCGLTPHELMHELRQLDQSRNRPDDRFDH